MRRNRFAFALLFATLAGCQLVGYGASEDRELGEANDPSRGLDPIDDEPRRPEEPASPPRDSQDDDGDKAGALDGAVGEARDAGARPPFDDFWDAPSFRRDGGPRGRGERLNERDANANPDDGDVGRGPGRDPEGPRVRTDVECVGEERCELSCSRRGREPCELSCSEGDQCELGCQGSVNCALSCDAVATCAPTCGTGASCFIECRDTERCRPRCEPGSRCWIECEGSSCRDVECAPGAACLLRCRGGSECSFSTCSDNLIQCGPRTAVCGANRCPDDRS